ncbi:MAG: superoxide dismutase [Ni] [Planctomycetota bacterium]
MSRSKSFFVAVACVLITAVFALANEPNTEPVTAPLPITKSPTPHCEVPCGIYADQMRFEQMLEDTATIAKAIDSVLEFSEAMGNGNLSAKSINQVSRWIQTKENHATNTQHIIAQYFLTQRIKADKENYTKQLTAAHSVMVAAMKCKQDANPETAKTLKKTILDLYRAYEGKEPKFHEHK